MYGFNGIFSGGFTVKSPFFALIVKERQLFSFLFNNQIAYDGFNANCKSNKVPLS